MGLLFFFFFLSRRRTKKDYKGNKMKIQVVELKFHLSHITPK